MPGPIGIGGKIVRTAVARQRNQAVLRGGERSEGRSAIDDVQDYRQARSLLSRRGTASVGESREIATYEESFYSMAIEMCANEGQKAIIQSMGMSAFSQAATAHSEGGDAVGELLALCPHEEVVGEILMEVGSAIADEVESQWY